MRAARTACGESRSRLGNVSRPCRHDSPLRPRPRPDPARLDAGRRAPQQPRPRPARRAARLPPPLGRRAPQHAGDRERRDGRRRRLPRRGHLDDPRRRRRDHAAEPLAARDRGAVRHARVALPRPHRPRARTGARDRPAHRARPAARPDERERVPAGRAGAAVPPRRRCSPGRRSGPCRAPGSRCRSGSSARARSAPGSRPRSASRTPSPRTSRPTTCWPRSRSTAASSVPRRSSPSRTRWPASTSFAADTDEEARRLFTTPQQSWANRFRGLPGPYPPPIDDIEAYWTPAEKAQASAHARRYSVVGSPETVRAGVERFVELTGVDEVMVVSAIYDHAARLRSYEILAEAACARFVDAPSAASQPFHREHALRCRYDLHRAAPPPRFPALPPVPRGRRRPRRLRRALRRRPHCARRSCSSPTTSPTGPRSSPSPTATSRSRTRNTRRSQPSSASIAQWVQLPNGSWLSEKNPGYPFFAAPFQLLGILRPRRSSTARSAASGSISAAGAGSGASAGRPRSCSTAPRERPSSSPGGRRCRRSPTPR